MASYNTRDGAVGLLEAVLRDSPDLRGAACKGRGRWFDPDLSAEAAGFRTNDDREQAITVTCVSCPVRARCWEWATSVSPNRITGPTAASTSIAGAMRWRGPRRAAALRATEDQEDTETEIATPRPAQRRGARSKVRPSINRRGRRNRG